MRTRPPNPPTSSALLTRREALVRTAALLGSALTAPTIAGVLAGCGDQRPSNVASAAQTLRAFTPAQELLVAALAEVILPTTDTPGARDVGVSFFVDRMLADYHTAESREAFLAGLVRIDAKAQTQHERPFVECTAAQQFALVDDLDAQVFGPRTVHVTQTPRSSADAGPVARDAKVDIDTRAFYAVLKELTLAGYYTSEAGATRELRVNPMGRWRADVPYGELRTGWA
ncbi:MAG: gluconate 2-dehydrogenase subunit 3 family protein [Gemmatimonadaceae bacterium]|nr:gluconate 2-dehydrogenase subunit 3 family protein [Gemmatimonadaceae bacterium]